MKKKDLQYVLIDKISLKGESEEEKVVDNLLLKEVLGKVREKRKTNYNVKIL